MFKFINLVTLAGIDQLDFTMQEVAVIKIKDEYPFGADIPKDKNISKILCHKVISVGEQKVERQNIMRKIRSILSHKFSETCLIKIQTVIEQEEFIGVYYEYIAISAGSWMRKKNQEAIQEIKQSVKNLSLVLADLKIVSVLNMQNLGITKNGQPRYYLQLDFEINDGLSKDHLMHVYQSNINQMFEQIQAYTGKARNRKSNFEDKKQKLDMNHYMFSPQFAPDSGQSFIAPLSFKDNSSQRSKQKKTQLQIPQGMRLTTRSATRVKQTSCQDCKIDDTSSTLNYEPIYSRGGIQAELIQSVRSAGNYKKTRNRNQQQDQTSERISKRVQDRQEKRVFKNQSIQDEVVNRLKEQEYECLKNTKGSYYLDFANILDNQSQQQDSENRVICRSAKNTQRMQMQMSIATQDSQRIVNQRPKQPKTSNNTSLKIEKQGTNQIKGRVSDAINQSMKVIQKLRKMKLNKN